MRRLRKLERWELRLGAHHASAHIAEAFRGLGLDVREESTTRVVGKRTSLRPKREPMLVTFDLTPAGSGTNALVTLELSGNQQAAALNEIANAIGPSHVLSRADTRPGEQPPPAGWYPDPSGEKRLRWWDGARWTTSTTD